jgi:CBS domain-containing protein
MSDLEQYIISSNATLLEAIDHIQRNKSRCVFAIRDGKMVGVISEGDVMRYLLTGIDVHTIISEIMKPAFVFLSKYDLDKASVLIHKHLFTLIPIIDEEFHLQSVITLRDVLDHLAKKA